MKKVIATISTSLFSYAFIALMIGSSATLSSAVYAADFGEESACSDITDITVGDVVNGSLSNEDDCYQASPGRMGDRFSLSLETNTTLNFQMVSSDFRPMIGVAERGDTPETILSTIRGVRLNPGGNQIDGQVVLAAGEYVVFATSFNSNAGDPPTGNYTLTLAESSEAQANCALPTFMYPEGPAVDAAISMDDCELPDRDDLTISETPRYFDQFSVLAPIDDVFNWSIQAEFDYRLEHWVTFNGTTTNVGISPTIAAGQSRVFGVTIAQGTNTFNVVAVNPGDTGDYSIAFDDYFEDQRDALFSLYNATDGANWTDNSGWLGDEGTECNWFGVSCEDNKVREIDLSGNNLVGTIPEDLRLISDLVLLDLGDNQLTGSVPSAVYKMDSLETLQVAGNNLSQSSVVIEFAYTFDASAAGTAGHVLRGIVDGIMLDDEDTFEVERLRGASLAGASYAIGQTPGYRSGRAGVAPVLSLSGDFLDFWSCPAGFTSEGLDDCAFGTEGGFLISETWEGFEGNGAVHAGNVGVVYDNGGRDSDRPINRGNWATRVSSEQRATLISLFEATDGENWTNKSGWLDLATSECEWYGVTCTDGDVVGLNLSSNQLSGDVPSSIYELPTIANINLNGNTLTGVVTGTESACTDLDVVQFGDVINGSLSNVSDCFIESTGRLTDRVAVSTPTNAIINLTLNASGFQPLVGLSEMGATPETFIGPFLGVRGIPSSSFVAAQLIVPAGDYIAFVSSLNADVDSPPTGSYTLTLAEFAEPQVGCIGSTIIFVEGPGAETAIDASDCVLPSREDLDASETPRYFDRYSFDLDADEVASFTIETDFDYRLEHWVSVGSAAPIMQGVVKNVAAGQNRVYRVDSEVLSTHMMIVVAINPGEAGNYALWVDDYFEDQYDALYSLYSATNGENWTDNTGWLGDEGTECSWFGIACDDGIVTQIVLSENNLVGTIPSDLHRLVDLTTLDLSDNLLTGRVPSAIYRMSALETLDVSGNSLSQSTILIDFSYTFDATAAGTAGHVLEGTLNGIMLDDNDTFEVVGIVAAKLAGEEYELGETQGLRAAREGVAPVLSLSGEYLDFWTCPAGFASATTDGSEVLNDCDFGADNGFLISENWASFGGIGAVHAGHADVAFDEGQRDSDRPIVRENWQASIRVVVPDLPTTPPVQNPTSTINDLETSLNDIIVVDGEAVSEETTTKVNDALTNSNTLANQVINNLPEGSAGVDLALSALSTMNKTLTVTGSVQQQGGQVANAVVVSSLGNVANVFNAMSSRNGTLTTTQKQNVQNITDSTVGNSANMIRTTSSNEDLVNLVAATSAVINAAASAGAELTPELATKTEQLVTKAIKTGMKSFSANIDTEDPVQLENLLRTNSDALEFAVAASVAVTSRIKTDSNAISTELSNRGVSASVSVGLTTVLDAVSNTNGVTVGGVSATDALLSALSQFLTGGAVSGQQAGLVLQALSSTGVQIDVDPITGSLVISTPSELYYGAAVSIRMVSNSMPKGISYMRDGRALVVGDGLAIEIAPTPSDIIGFTAAVQGAGYNLRLRKNGALEINLGNGELFSGAMAFDNLSGFSENCGAINFIERHGALNSAQYAFEVQCANGATQRVTPFVHDSKFFTAIASNGEKLSTDRNTGVLSIEGVGRFKAGFFVSPLSVQEKAYLAQNGTIDGIALQTLDVNGDGINDMIFMSAAGTQPIYGMAP